jgi:AcrR family transcriptional regulator
LPQPQQVRSQATRERILRAAERLLRSHLFEDISVRQLVAEAGVSIGSFYNLYGEKDALLPDLYARHCREMIDELEAIAQPTRWADASLTQLVRAVVERVVAIYAEQRGLMRALVLRSHCRHPGTGPRDPAMDSIVPRIAALVAERRSEILHPSPKRAAGVGLLMVIATARECLLYPDTTAWAVALPERALVGELTRAWLGYLDWHA